MFYFVHEYDYGFIEDILASRYLYAHKYLDDKYVKSYDVKPINYVFTYVIFESLIKKYYNTEYDVSDNETKLINQPIIEYEFCIIIDPKIIKDKNVILKSGWSGVNNIDESIKINKNDSIRIIKDKLKKFKKQIINRFKINRYARTHEALFKKRISLDKYMIGITCTEKYKDHVKVLLNKYKYSNNIKIFTYLPTYSALIS
jgi:hypothetical protein